MYNIPMHVECKDEISVTMNIDYILKNHTLDINNIINN